MEGAVGSEGHQLPSVDFKPAIACNRPALAPPAACRPSHCPVYSPPTAWSRRHELGRRSTRLRRRELGQAPFTSAAVSLAEALPWRIENERREAWPVELGHGHQPPQLPWLNPLERGKTEKRRLKRGTSPFDGRGHPGYQRNIPLRHDSRPNNSEIGYRPVGTKHMRQFLSDKL